MVQSNYVFKSGEPIEVGSHGDTDYVFHSGDPVPNRGSEGYVFESGSTLGVATNIIDDFERNNLDPYVKDYGAGVTGDFSVVSGSPAEGTYWLQATETGQDTGMTIYSFPGDGLPYYPQSGDTFRWYIQLGPVNGGLGSHIGFGWGVQSLDDVSGETDWLVDVQYDQQEIDLFYPDGETSFQQSVSLSLDTLYEVEVEFQVGGTTTVRLFEGATEKTSFSVSDTATVQDNGIVWEGERGWANADYARKVA